MNYALVGFGKMGRAIEAQAEARGHRRRLVVDPDARGAGTARSLAAARWRGVDVAFEFTQPAAARDNVLALLRRGVRVVCGTTGWDASDPEVRRAARASGAGAVIAANFSPGMGVFYALAAAAAARLAAVGGYDPWLAEWHHKAKRDVPSGTASRLAALVEGAAPWPGGVPVAAVRAGHEPGRHVLGFDGPHDAITLVHAARNRDGFALGAVLAAEWLASRRGLHGFDEVMDDLVRARGRRGGRR